MLNKDNGEMHMGSYMFMGIHVFWWFSIIVLGMLLLAAAHKYRRKKWFWTGHFQFKNIKWPNDLVESVGVGTGKVIQNILMCLTIVQQ